MNVPNNTINWLQEAETPYIQYMTGLLLKKAPSPPRKKLVQDPFISQNINLLKEWDHEVLTRHDKADLLIHRLTLIADCGVKASDPGLKSILAKVLKVKDKEGIFQIKIKIPKAFGGEDSTEWMWTMCDFPLILYAVQKMGVPEKEYSGALSALVNMVDEDGYRCLSSKPKFKGPGAKTSICPYGNLLAAKALGVSPITRNTPAAHRAVEALLHHWKVRTQKKYFLFGIGTEFKKLKFPLIWYNLLHVVYALSFYPLYHTNNEFIEMWELLTSKADDKMRFTPESMYRVYKEQDFSNKKEPSRTVTLVVYEIAKRLGKLIIV